jgi:molybdopterin synthase catalytic subunit
MNPKFLLTERAIDERGAAEALDARGAGAVVTFAGRVRDRSGDRSVTKLEYEAYPEMAEGIFAQIGDEAKSRFEIRDIVIHHRTGSLAVGEVSVAIAVSAEHRAAAFEACRYAIDRLKQIAPIWKKEYSPDGAVWVENRP